jgi:alpha-D-xyloside xylohydrolase
MYNLINPGKLLFVPLFVLLAGFGANAQYGNVQNSKLVNDPVDISGDFRDFSNTIFVADSLAAFDPATGAGTIKWKRNEPFSAHNFDNSMLSYKRSFSNEFPAIEYAQDPVLPFSIEFTSPRTVRIRANTGAQGPATGASLMLTGEPAKDASWKYSKISGGISTPVPTGR